MALTAQKRALRNYRARLAKDGLARFEVLGLGSDRALLRALARRLAEGGNAAAALRQSITRSVDESGGPKGGVLQALRRSPLVGADLTVERERGPGRAVTL